MEVKLRQRKRKNKISLNLAYWVKERQVFKTGKTKSGKWRIEPLRLYLYPGRDRKAQNDETLAFAKTLQVQRQAELQAGEYGLIPEHKRRGDFILFFEKLADEKDKNWRQAARVLKKYSPQPIAFQSLNEMWLLDFQKYLLKEKKNNMSWLIEGKIRAGIKIALRQRLIRSNFLPMAPSIKYQQGPKTFLDSGEIQRLIDTPFEKEFLKRAFLFSCFTGLRYSDVKKIIWRNVETDFISFVSKKTKQPERLPLNAYAKQILSEQKGKVIDPDANIFPMLSPAQTNSLLRKWARKAGIGKHLHFHVGRHTFAFLLLNSGVGVYDAQKAMAHKNISTTMVYAHMVPTELKKRIDDLLPHFDLERGAK